MNEVKEEDWLDRQLREAAPYIDDKGFTARVLQQLSAPRYSRRSFRGAILLAMALLASVLAYLLSDGGRFLVVAATRLTTLPTLWLFVLALGSGILVMAGGVIAALSKTRELQS
jgi:type IV secretory pathway TrbL component